MEREHEAEFDEFFASTYPAIVRSAALVVGDREVAREIAQDAFGKALLHWKRVRMYEHPGAFDFAERAISATTGTLGLRAKFLNPQFLLRPGLNVRVRLVYDEVKDALLVPQRAVTELLGKQFVTVIGADNKVEQRPVTLGERVGELWIVQSGLKAGERIFVDGTQKAPAGASVAPTMITEAQLDQPPVAVAAPAAKTPGK